MNIKIENMRPGSSSMRQGSEEDNPVSDFEIDRLLGKGTFGTVFLVLFSLLRHVGKVSNAMWP